MFLTKIVYASGNLSDNTSLLLSPLRCLLHCGSLEIASASGVPDKVVSFCDELPTQPVNKKKYRFRKCDFQYLSLLSVCC